MFTCFPYVIAPALTHCLESDVPAFLEANGRPKTLAHVQAVAEVCGQIAMQYGLDGSKCRAAGLLHDISAVIRPADMLHYITLLGLPVCEAEARYNFLLHQRMSRFAAAKHFGITDIAVLSAIECHTTLHANATPYDMALFIADKLAWDQPGTPPYDKVVRYALERSLEAACLAYMEDTMSSGRMLCPHTNWTLAVDWLKQKS
ncbi:MAG: HD domain-containing protein [Clostridia bacterium]|nr:HD domain-containing protein [Clostridia bacterium]